MDILNHYFLFAIFKPAWGLAIVQLLPDSLLAVIKLQDIVKGQSVKAVVNETNKKDKTIDNSKLFYGHKILHSLFIPLALSFFSIQIAGAYFLHIVIDMLTHKGDYYLMPLKIKFQVGLIEWTTLNLETKAAIAFCFILLGLIVS
jgi:hypothetical protein